jgi:hypothetical protein
VFIGPSSAARYAFSFCRDLEYLSGRETEA